MSSNDSAKTQIYSGRTRAGRVSDMCTESMLFIVISSCIPVILRKLIVRKVKADAALKLLYSQHYNWNLELESIIWRLTQQPGMGT